MRLFVEQTSCADREMKRANWLSSVTQKKSELLVTEYGGTAKAKEKQNKTQKRD